MSLPSIPIPSVVAGCSNHHELLQIRKAGYAVPAARVAEAPSTRGQCSQQWQGTSLIRHLCRLPGASLWLSSQQSFSPSFSSYMQLLPYSLSLLLVTMCLSLGAERRLFFRLSTFNLVLLLGFVIFHQNHGASLIGPLR